MSTETTSIAPGWYTDPSGSRSLRWWDGTQWTDDLRQPEALEVPAADAAPVAAGGVNNSIAWFGLVAGIVAVVAVAIRIASPSAGLWLPVFGLTAIVASIRALLRYRNGRVSVLWAPIVGLVLGGIAELLLLALMIAPILGTHDAAALTGTKPAPRPYATAGPLGPMGAITIYDAGTATPTYLPTNPRLATAVTAENKVVKSLFAAYADGKTGAAADGSFPAHLIFFPSGNVTSSDGKNLGKLIPAGARLAYSIQPDGSFVLGIANGNSSEVAIYASQYDHYVTTCEQGDTACQTKSPVAPVNQTDNDSATS